MADEEFLSKVSWLAPLDEAQRAKVAACMSPCSWNAGETIASAGDEAHAIYLIRKGTAPKRPMYENIAKYLIVNALKSIWPEPFIDRRGRLKGNLVGLFDIVRGRSRPDRILEL